MQEGKLSADFADFRRLKEEESPSLSSPSANLRKSAKSADEFWFSTRWANAALLVLGALILVLCCKGAHDQNMQRMLTFLSGVLGLLTLYGVAAWVVCKARPARSTLVLGLVFAAGFRVAPLTTDAYLSTDLYRYIWDGRVQASGTNPFRYVPADEHLTPLRDERVYPHINRRDYARTVYPPGSQVVFLLCTRLSETVTDMRLTMVFFEAVTVWLLARTLAAYGLPTQRVLLYAWHPLPIWEFAGGGHQDAIMLACLAGALLAHRRGQPTATGFALGCAVLTKLYPIILFPALYRKFRWGWRLPLACAATVIVGYVPYCVTYSLPGALGFLPKYTEEEGLQSGDRFYLLNMLPSGWMNAHGVPVYQVFVVLVGLGFALTAAWAFWKCDADEYSVVRRCAFLAAMFLAVLSPGVPWYATWLVPFLCLLPRAWPLYWSTAFAQVLYFNWWHGNADELFLQNSAIFLPAIALWLTGAALRWYRARHPSAQIVAADSVV